MMSFDLLEPDQIDSEHRELGLQQHTGSHLLPCVQSPGQPKDSENRLLGRLMQLLELFVPWAGGVYIYNVKAFTKRFIRLLRDPEQLAPLSLDLCSFFLSIIWRKREGGPDLLYPFASLKIQRSERLARLLIEHSRDPQHRNLHVATSPVDGVDPIRAAVIDLNEVPQEVLNRGYSVAIDLHGYWVVLFLLQIVFIQFLGFVHCSFTLWSPQFFLALSTLFLMRSIAGSGNGLVTLVQRSNISTPGCAVLLDRDISVVLLGPQNIVEAIGECWFRVSYPSTATYRPGTWRSSSPARFFYRIMDAFWHGVPALIFVGTALALLSLVPRPVLQHIAIAVWIVSRCIPLFYTTTAWIPNADATDTVAWAASVFAFWLLDIPATQLRIRLIQGLVIIKRSFDPAAPLLFPLCWLMESFLYTADKYHIRTEKFLDILGHPPVRRWEFDTLAAAATFQCLVVCRDIPRPVKKIDVLGLLNNFILDDRDVWKAWKDRVADRIVHEVDIRFLPTIPTFGDPERQKHLKELLDHAQIGYDVFRNFYDHRTPLFRKSSAKAIVSKTHRKFRMLLGVTIPLFLALCLRDLVGIQHL